MSTFSDNREIFYVFFSRGRGGAKRDHPETARALNRALNFYMLLGAAATKSTTSSASKTASARLRRPPVVALINRPTSIVRFNKVQQSGTQHGDIPPCRLLRRVYLTLSRFTSFRNTFFSPHSFLFLQSHT